MSVLGEAANPIASAAARSFSVEAEALVLTCIDCRFHDPQLAAALASHRLTISDCDIVRLAGASLGVDLFAGWRDAFLFHVGFCVRNHGIRKVVILDHEGCGMYDAFDFPATATEHRLHMDRVAQLVMDYFPSLRVSTGIMTLSNATKQTKARAVPWAPDSNEGKGALQVIAGEA
jgi:carbonic anhydrase